MVGESMPCQPRFCRIWRDMAGKAGEAKRRDMMTPIASLAYVPGEGRHREGDPSVGQPSGGLVVPLLVREVVLSYSV